MSIKKLEKKNWQNYFDTFSRKFLSDEQPEYAGILVLNGDIGAQPVTQWLVLKGITYDRKSDLIDIQMEHLNRVINHPEEIFVDESDDGWLLSMEVVQQDGTRDIIETR